MKRFFVASVVAFLSSIAADGLHQQSARADSAVAWGWNAYGQLGDGTTTNRLSPVAVHGLESGVTAVAGGYLHNLALKNGTVWAWGSNPQCQIGDGTTTNRFTPVAVSALGSSINVIASGGAHGLAIKDGGVWDWGWNIYGQLGDGTANNRSTPALVSAMDSGVTLVASGYDFSFALKDGHLWGWGDGQSGQLGDGTTGSDRLSPVPVLGMDSGVTAVKGGVFHTLAVKDGGVWAWGRNNYGQLGDGTTIARNAPVPITSLASDVTAIASGNDFSLAVKDGGVWAWGSNIYGQLGDGTKTDRHGPVQIDPVDLTNITAVAAGYDSSYALSTDGSLWVWGQNGVGELGLGDTTQRLTPTHLLPPSGFRFTSIEIGQWSYDVVATLAPVPEPSTLLLLGIGAIGLFVWRRRQAA